MNKVALLIMLATTVAPANSEYCLVEYQSDFAFSERRYVTDIRNGFTAEVSWGPHGFVGAILQPRVGNQERVPVERFETFYQSLNCQWDSIDFVWEDFAQTFADRKDCSALVYGSGEATFRCGHLLHLFWLDQDVLGAFQKYEFRATGPWYQSTEYATAKEELNRLAAQALSDAQTAIIDAVSTPKCHADVNPELIELRESDQHLPTNLASNVDASIAFTVGTDGAVSEIMLGQTSDYLFESFMAWGARRHRFPEQDRRCRATWTHVFR